MRPGRQEMEIAMMTIMAIARTSTNKRRRRRRPGFALASLWRPKSIGLQIGAATDLQASSFLSLSLSVPFAGPRASSQWTRRQAR